MKPKHPISPRLARYLLQGFLKDHLTEEVLGDLEEKFQATVNNHSITKAKLNYWYQAFHYLRPFALKRFRSNSNYLIMYQHNLLISLRVFKRYTSSFLINLIGLSTGLACVLFIYLWISDELKIDKFHKNNVHLYQVMSNMKDASGIHTWRGVPGLLLDELQSTIPEITTATATTDAHEYTLSVGESFTKAQGKFASKDFFSVFTYPFVQGSPDLSNKSGIAISETLALRLFNTTDVIGRDINWHFWSREKTVEVTGVFQDIPSASSETFDFLLSWDYFHDDLITYKTWYNYYGRILVVLNANTSPQAVEGKIDAILKAKQEGEDNVALFLANYADNYLYGHYENGVQTGGRIEYVRLFGLIGLFILFIACINFINLSTAKATHRTKEIGVKKSLGASRGSLISQYFTESVLLGVTSLLAAIGMVWLLLPQFNYLTQKQLELNFTLEFILTSLSLVTIVGILAGSYPALFLSGLNALDTIKGKLNSLNRQGQGRQLLVGIQFTLSIILITGVVVVYNQMDFVKNKNLGYDKDNLVYFEREGELLKDSEAFIETLKKTTGIKDAVMSGFIVGGGNATGGVSWEGKTPDDQVQFWEIRSGYGLTEIMDMEILEGRSFSNDFKLDSAGVLLNETAVKAMGLTDPIGKTITHYSGDRKILGIVKDFNLISLHTAVEPMIFLYEPQKTHFIMAKLEVGTEVNALQNMEDLYRSFNPGYVFKPQFIDQDYQALYQSEERVGVLSRYFSGLAIIISCLGLFGLAAFTTERRTKEIGIRKILGAGNQRIVFMLSQDFTKVIIVAIGLALPISYYVTRQWLNTFAFRIELEWWYFALSGLAALLIAWLTVGLQTIRAIRINPVECLKDE